MSIVWGSDSNVISNPDAKHVAAAEEEVVSDEVHSTLWISAMYVVFCIWNQQWFPKLGIKFRVDQGELTIKSMQFVVHVSASAL